jgi:hypothetical protein
MPASWQGAGAGGGHLTGERVRFDDIRSPIRRKFRLTRSMVISLWQGDICTGTFSTGSSCSL